ncbi:hypothetical protein ACFQ1M_10565 [Sungkyunkwania multivorans]|uniref:Lipoprotein n=1 Tax=Sungkyunkwania multivorans TaxID=1173618 RepID=A0ABW3CYM8_9FLAO
MKNRKLKFILVSILTFAMLSMFVTSCSKDDNQNDLETNEVIQTDNDILAKALQTEEVLNFQSTIHGGELALDQATYEEVADENGDKDGAFITIPIRSYVANQSKGLYIHYDFLTKEFKHEVIAVTFGQSFVDQVKGSRLDSIDHLSDSEVENLGLSYSATYEFFALDGVLSGRLTYEDNILIEDYENSSRVSYWCLFKCMVGKLSWRERISCGWAAISCISGNWVSCVWNIYRCAKNGPRYYRDCRRRC